MKIIHFDCYDSEKKYQKKKEHTYISQNVQTYLKERKQIEADIVTGFVHSDFKKEVIDSVKNLKLIVTRSAGMDNIDTKYCDQKNINYKNTTYPSHNVAHHTIALILYFSRQLETYKKTIQKGKFCDRKVDCFDLKNKKIGIIGHGRIGQQVVKLAENLGMEVLVYDREKSKCSLVDGINTCDFESVLKNSDIISLHCDANPTTIGMINNESIKKMKDKVVLINTARGAIINEKDLLKNIKKFSFVGLDVLENENKFTKKHPFLKHPNIFITPHIAYKSEETTKERWAQTYSHIEEFCKD